MHKDLSLISYWMQGFLVWKLNKKVLIAEHLVHLDNA